MVPIYIWTINIYLSSKSLPSNSNKTILERRSHGTCFCVNKGLSWDGIRCPLSHWHSITSVRSSGFKRLNTPGSGSHHVFEELPSYSPIPNPNLKQNNQQKVAKRGKTGNSYLFRYLRMLPPRNNDSKSSLDSSGWQTERDLQRNLHRSWTWMDENYIATFEIQTGDLVKQFWDMICIHTVLLYTWNKTLNRCTIAYHWSIIIHPYLQLTQDLSAICFLQFVAMVTFLNISQMIHVTRSTASTF